MVIRVIIVALFVNMLVWASPAMSQQATPPTFSPPSMQLEIAGKTLWLRMKGDVWGGFTDDQRAFVEKFVSTINSGSLAQIQSLIAPESRDCLKDLPKEIIDREFSGLLGNNIQGEYTLLFEPLVQKFDPDFAAQQKVWYVDPIPHTHTFGIGFLNDGKVPSLLTFRLIKRGIDYQIVLPCPTEFNVKNFEQEKVSSEAYVEGLKQAIAALTQPQVDILRTMASNHAQADIIAQAYTEMHPTFERYAIGVGSYFADDWIESQKEKLKDQKPSDPNIPPPNPRLANVLPPDPSEKAAVATPVPEAVTTVPESPYQRLHMALILALIFAAGILLLRVLKAKKPRD